MSGAAPDLGPFEDLGAIIEGIDGKVVNVRLVNEGEDYGKILELRRSNITSKRIRRGDPICMEGTRLPDGSYRVKRAYVVELDPPLDEATRQRLRDKARAE
ncbi:hypothetical protein HY497_01745, partial [Candidatus Woesearchaeota archaeon]|nr:hypothetical protein [Candidatus Woesearchaeota archaeon]